MATKNHKFLHVEDAVYLKDYLIFFKMDDGSYGVMDFKDELWGEVFAPLKDKKKFRNFFVNEITGTIEWPTGADLAPEYIKANLRQVKLQPAPTNHEAHI